MVRSKKRLLGQGLVREERETGPLRRGDERGKMGGKCLCSSAVHCDSRRDYLHPFSSVKYSAEQCSAV